MKSTMPIMDTLNHLIPHSIHWCTPSISPKVTRVHDVYFSDMSISYHELGNPALCTGIFGEAHKLAAKAYKADETVFSVNGTTGSNFMVIKALKKQLDNVHILAQRNIHKSICAACCDFRVKISYLKPSYDEKYQIFIPNSINDYMEAIKKDSSINVILITNPTYEGLSLDLKQLIRKVRRTNKDMIIFVDEAWGAHFNFSKKLPKSAMEHGADISVQSTHKQGSGLQQTGMIHWKKKRINSEIFHEVYKSLITTSPSFHLLASLDAARDLFEKNGEQLINDLILITERLQSGLSKLTGVRCLSFDKLKKKYPQLDDYDKTKLLVNFEKTNLSAIDIAEKLQNDYEIIVEKYEANNILFLSPLQNTMIEANATINAVEEILSRKELLRSNKTLRLSRLKFSSKIIKKMELYEVDLKAYKPIPLENCVGKTIAEDIIPYPPGIPLITKGEIIQETHITYLEKIRNTEGKVTVMAADETLNTIRCVK